MDLAYETKRDGTRLLFYYGKSRQKPLFKNYLSAIANKVLDHSISRKFRRMEIVFRKNLEKHSLAFICKG